MNGPIRLPEYLHPPRIHCCRPVSYEAVFLRAELRNPNRDTDFFASRASAADMLMDELPGELKTYYANEGGGRKTRRGGDEGVSNPSSCQDSRRTSSLKLKEGRCPRDAAPQFSPQRSLHNGTRLVVTRLYRYAIEGRILAGDQKGEVHIIPWLPHSGPTPVAAGLQIGLCTSMW
jgi:hypothetical protein